MAPMWSQGRRSPSATTARRRPPTLDDPLVSASRRAPTARGGGSCPAIPTSRADPAPDPVGRLRSCSRFAGTRSGQMIRRFRMVGLLLALGPIALLGACSSSGEALSEDEYIEEYCDISSEVEEDIADIEGPE